MWNDQTAQLTLHVVKGYGPALFGRDWLGITHSSDWHQIHYSSSSNLQGLLDRYGDVFEAGLGTFKGRKARIEVEPNAKPHYRKARTVPFALRKQVCGLVGWLVVAFLSGKLVCRLCVTILTFIIRLLVLRLICNRVRTCIDSPCTQTITSTQSLLSLPATCKRVPLL